MKKKFLTLLCIPFLLVGCAQSEKDLDNYQERSMVVAVHTGEIGDFSLLTPANGFSASHITFTWEAASNSDYYQIEIANTRDFSIEEEDVYVKESNLVSPRFELSYSLQEKDILYYWKVTAVNKDHTKVSSEVGNFFYESTKEGEIPIKIEDADDWTIHKEGSYADISIDRSDFFGNGQNSLAIVFDKEHTFREPADQYVKSNGWLVVTKSENRELYGTDSIYFNFYYSGHDSNIFVRFLDGDGEYWHKQVQIANNSKQTILLRYDEFELRTAGTNIYNKRFDWEHIRYFEIVFEKTYGDGVCMFSNIKAVRYDDYKYMFMDKMDFRRDDMSTWTFENYNYGKTVSENGDEITLEFNTSNGFSGYGFQNINVYKYFVQGDAIRMKIKYTGASSNAVFYFRILEEDMDRWQFKTPISYFVKNEYKELIIPLKAFQRTDYMQGDGAKQFYFIQKFNTGLADNYASGTLSIKDLEVIKIESLFPDPDPTNPEIESPIVSGVGLARRTVEENGKIEDFNDYSIYTQIYYYWEQSVVNKDESMKLDNVHKAGGRSNPYCGEFDYKADMEMASYQLYLDSSKATGKNALSLWLKDASVIPDDPAVAYLETGEYYEKFSVNLTIQLTMDSGEWYRYNLPVVNKEWTNYTLAFDDLMEKDDKGEIIHNGWFLENRASLYNDPKDLDCEHVVHMAFGMQYFYYDENDKPHPTYAIANPVYIDEIYFVQASETSVVEIPSTLKPDANNANQITVDTMENYATSEDIFDGWYYASTLDYNSMTLADDVSSQGGSHSLKMHYKGSNSVSYARVTQLARTVTAKGIAIDIKGDGVATVFINLNWRTGNTLLKMRYSIESVPAVWTHYEIGFTNFVDAAVPPSAKKISMNYAKNIEYISFGITNKIAEDPEDPNKNASDIYVDNIRFLSNNAIGYSTNTAKPIE